MSISISEQQKSLDGILASQEGRQDVEMASDQHGEIGAIVIGALVNYVCPNKYGRVFNAQTNFKLNADQPPRLPDAAFVAAERLPALRDADIPFAPDLAVEVISRNDDWS